MKCQLLAIGLAAVSTLGAMTSPLSAQTVERTVDVKAVKASTNWIDSFDQNIPTFFTPDFYVVPTLNGQQLSKSKAISDNMNPTFNHTVAAKVSLAKTRIPITLKLMDSDTFPDSDDLADINPLSGQDVLTLNYEPGTGSVYGPDGNKLGVRGQQITVKGDKDKHGVEITFAINHQDATASNPQPPKDPSCPVAATNCQPK